MCLVLGAGPCIGYSLGKMWAKNGYQVVLVRRNVTQPEEIREQVGESVVCWQAKFTLVIPSKFGRNSVLTCISCTN